MTKIDEVINLWLDDTNAYGNELSLAIKKAIAEELDKLKADLIFKTNKYGYDFCVTLFNKHIEKVKKELCGEEEKGK